MGCTSTSLYPCIYNYNYNYSYTLCMKCSSNLKLITIETHNEKRYNKNSIAKYSLKSDILASDWIKQPVAKFLTLMILHT